MKEIIEFFKQNGFICNQERLDIHQKNKDGNSPFQLAIQQGKVALAMNMMCIAQEQLHKEIQKNTQSNLQHNSAGQSEKPAPAIIFGTPVLERAASALIPKLRDPEPMLLKLQDIQDLETAKKFAIQQFQEFFRKLESAQPMLNIDGAEFKRFHEEFEKWAFVINSLLKTERTELLLKDEFLPFRSKTELAPDSIIIKCQQLLKDHIQDQNKAETLLKAKYIMDRIQDMEFVKPDDVPDTSLEDVENQIISHLVGVQIILEVCINLQQAMSKIPESQKHLQAVQELIKTCEEHLINTRKNIENEMMNNFKKQTDLEKMASYLSDLEIELHGHGLQYRAWENECREKRKQVLKQQKHFNDYMLMYLKRMRLGLMPGQQCILLADLEKAIVLYEEQQKKALDSAEPKRCYEIDFEKQDTDFVKTHSHLIQVFSNRVHKAGDTLLGELLKYQKSALTEQINFFYHQVQYLEQFCKEQKLQHDRVEVTQGFLQKLPLSFGLFSLYPQSTTQFKTFASAISVHKNEVQKRIEGILPKLEDLERRIGNLQRKLEKIKNNIHEQREVLSLTQNENTNLMRQVNHLKEKLLSQSLEGGFDDSQLKEYEDIFSCLYVLNDAIVENIKYKIDSLSFEAEMQRENLNDYVQMYEEECVNLSEYQATKYNLALELPSYLDKISKLNEELKVAKEENSLNKEFIDKMQEMYYQNQNKIESFRERLPELQQLETMKKEKSNRLLQCKSNLEEELDKLQDEYIHIFWIHERIQVRYSILGLKAPDARDEDSEDLGIAAKNKAQIAVEDICMAISGCAGDALENAWNEDRKILIENLKKVPTEIQKAGEFFLQQITDCFAEAEYEQSYIAKQTAQITKLWETLKSPCEEILRPNQRSNLTILS